MFTHILTVGDRGIWPISFQWFVGTGQGAMAKNGSHEVLHQHVKELLHGKGDGALEQAAQGGCAVSFSGDIQGPSGCLPGQPAVENLLRQGGWTQCSLKVPSNLYDSVSLTCCIFTEETYPCKDLTSSHLVFPRRNDRKDSSNGPNRSS